MQYFCDAPHTNRPRTLYDAGSLRGRQQLFGAPVLDANGMLEAPGIHVRDHRGDPVGGERDCGEVGAGQAGDQVPAGRQMSGESATDVAGGTDHEDVHHTLPQPGSVLSSPPSANRMEPLT
ncbi:hypothetical protein AB0D59_12330 [Streptomyces sp. NPDC048417]|uniref:hypothetical protein n=1 Tax=Streptomyces sp. NPDC048417 TaxID=3155387 RepID=UPI003432712E